MSIVLREKVGEWIDADNSVALLGVVEHAGTVVYFFGSRDSQTKTIDKKTITTYPLNGIGSKWGSFVRDMSWDFYFNYFAGYTLTEEQIETLNKMLVLNKKVTWSLDEIVNKLAKEL